MYKAKELRDRTYKQLPMTKQLGDISYRQPVGWMSIRWPEEASTYVKWPQETRLKKKKKWKRALTSQLNLDSLPY